jgi:hypothetical protein
MWFAAIPPNKSQGSSSDYITITIPVSSNYLFINQHIIQLHIAAASSTIT